MKGDRVEAVVDTGQGVQTFEIVATRAGRRIEVTTARGVVEVTEVTRGGTPVRTGRFMASRLVALVEHPAAEGDGTRVDVSTRRRISAPEEESTRGRRRDGQPSEPGGRARLRRVEAEPLPLQLDRPEAGLESSAPVSLRDEAERRREHPDEEGPG